MAVALRVSVIIPHLNEPEMLLRCLTALELQRRDGVPFEIIVVDNGSRQMPDAVCGEIADVRLEQENTPGPGPARNRGASVAAAPILAFIDADCIAQPGWVKAIASYLETHPDVSFIGGDIDIDPEKAGSLGDIEAYERIYSYRNRLYVEKYGFSATGNMAVRADVFRSVGPFGGITTMEDTEWGQRASAAGHVCAFVPEAAVLTPSCKSFAELAKRWDRHVAHEFGEIAGHPIKLLGWAMRIMAVAASPFAEAFRILGSDRPPGGAAKWSAFRCLVRVRLYRAWLMTRLALRDDTAERVGKWNRQNS